MVLFVNQHDEYDCKDSLFDDKTEMILEISVAVLNANAVSIWNKKNNSIEAGSVTAIGLRVTSKVFIWCVLTNFINSIAPQLLCSKQQFVSVANSHQQGI